VKKTLALVGWLGLSCVALSAATAGTTATTTARISVSSSGQQGHAASFLDAISATGRYVVFDSTATNLVRGDTNHAADVFLRDRKSGKTTRVSLGSGDKQANGPSGGGVISADGRYVFFSSDASNLVPHDTDHVSDVFVHDRKTGRTTRVSVTSAGKQAKGFASGNGSNGPSISADGRYVAFQSDASNLVPHDTNNVVDIFVHDRKTGRTARVNVSSSGEQADGESFGVRISANGRSVAFASLASNLVPGDTNQFTDVFVHDLKTDATTRVSVTSSGGQGNNTSVDPAISASGRYVAFSSDASNLVAGDTNGFSDIFVRDRVADTTRRVSLTKRGGQTNGAGGSLGKDISANGRWVAFESGATNLVPRDTNNAPDVFLRGPLPG